MPYVSLSIRLETRVFKEVDKIRIRLSGTQECVVTGGHDDYDITEYNSYKKRLL